MIRSLTDFIEATSDALLPSSIGAQFAGLAESLSYSGSVVFDMRALRYEAHSPIVFSRRPDEFEKYTRHASFADSPLGLCAAAMDTPFTVADACAALGMREHDLRRTLFPPVRDQHIVVLPVHRRGELVLFAACAGDKPNDGPTARATLHTAVHACYDLIVARDANRQLTRREGECLTAIAHGNSYKDAGRLLGIAERTVRAAVASAKRKLHARSQAEVIARAVGIDAQPTRAPRLPSQN